MLCEIRLSKEKDVNSIVSLLNKVTLNLHEKNIKQWTYPWNFEEINTDVKNKNVYIMTKDNDLAGTFSIREMDINKALHIMKPNNLYLYRIALLPEYQGKNMGIDILKYACDMSDNLRKPLYLDCWSGNIKLKKFYLRAGFKFCGDFEEEDYFISVFKYGQRVSALT